MSERMNVFAEEEETAPASPPAINLSGFQPKKGPKPDPQIDAIREAAEKRGFVNREPKAAVKPLQKADRRHRTGRNIHLAAKWTKVDEERLDRIYGGNRDPKTGKPKWTLGEILGMGLEVLEEKLDKDKGGE